MENSSTQAQSELGLDFWTKQFEYLEETFVGTQKALAVIASLREEAKNNMLELTPDKED